MKSTIPLFLFPALLAPILSAQIVEDDFNDGNDAGWERYSPLDNLGSPLAFTFPGGNRYRVQAPASINPDLAGPARGGAHRADVVYEAFRVEVDLVDWDNEIAQDIGLVGSLREVGLATTSGYALSYDTGGEALFLSILNAEQATSLNSVPITLIPGEGYRLVLQGFFDVAEFYGQLCGEVFALDDLETPLATVSGFSFDYPSGTCGVFTATTGSGTTDATFDNYRSSAETDADKDGMTDQWEVEQFANVFWFEFEDFDGDGQTNLEEFLGGSDPTDPASVPGSAEIGPLDVSVANGELVVGFAAQAGYAYGLETSSDLRIWTVAAEAVQAGPGTLVLPVSGQDELYVRVVASRE